jgi:hypothetical protein
MLVEHGDLDLPAPSQSDVRDTELDDRLTKRRPRNADILGGLLAGQPDGGRRTGEPVEQ